MNNEYKHKTQEKWKLNNEHVSYSCCLTSPLIADHSADRIYLSAVRFIETFSFS